MCKISNLLLTSQYNIPGISKITILDGHLGFSQNSGRVSGLHIDNGPGFGQSIRDRRGIVTRSLPSNILYRAEGPAILVNREGFVRRVVPRVGPV